MKKILLFCFSLVLLTSCCKHQEDVACKVNITTGGGCSVTAVYTGSKDSKVDRQIGSFAAKYFIPYKEYVKICWYGDEHGTYKKRYNYSYTFCVENAAELDVYVSESIVSTVVHPFATVNGVEVNEVHIRREK